MHCKDTILRTQNNWLYSKLIPNSGIYVDINDSLLGLHFLDKVDQVTITVVGVEGIVYQKEVTTPFPKSIYVDLNQYRSGEYTIYIKDTKGNLLWGNFLK